MLQCSQTQTDASIDALNNVAAEAESAARVQSLVRALEEARADAAALRTQLQECRSAAAVAEAHSREVSESLSVTEADLSTARRQLAEASEQEGALASRVKAQDLELAACRACSADLREDNARLRAEVAALKVCPCLPMMMITASLSRTELRTACLRQPTSPAARSVRQGAHLSALTLLCHTPPCSKCCPHCRAATDCAH